MLCHWTRELHRSVVLSLQLTQLRPSRFKSTLLDRLLVSHADQVDALLAEFRDHNVVRGSFVAPQRAGEDDEEDGDGEGEWVWIPLGRPVLRDVVAEMGH